MKKIIILSLMLILTGCGSAPVKTSNKPQIYTSFYAISDFVEKIGGDKVDVHNLVPSGTEPHDWEPSSKDMLNLNSADVLFYNGLGMESWIDKVKGAVNGEKPKYVELSAPFEHTKNDPHIWLDPKNVITMSQEICDTLSDLDPSNEEYYKENLATFTAQLNKLDNDFKTQLSNVSSKKIVVSHEAYSYLCSAYGLEQTSIDGISADSEPSPAKMKEIADYIKTNNVKYIFFEELVSPKIAQSLADETGVQLLALNPFEGLDQEDIDNGADYISVMEENLKNLVTALK